MSHDQKPTKMRVVGVSAQSASSSRSEVASASKRLAVPTGSASKSNARDGARVAGLGIVPALLFVVGCAVGAAVLSIVLSA